MSKLCKKDISYLCSTNITITAPQTWCCILNRKYVCMCIYIFTYMYIFTHIYVYMNWFHSKHSGRKPDWAALALHCSCKRNSSLPFQHELYPCCQINHCNHHLSFHGFYQTALSFQVNPKIIMIHYRLLNPITAQLMPKYWF